MFQPEVLNPAPDPFIVRELKKIDPELQVTWGYNRYLDKRWAIERRMSPERYFQSYASLLEADAPRFVDRPIYDANKPIKDPETEEIISYEQVGVQHFDLAPEYEWVAFVDALDMNLIDKIRRLYWEREHPNEVAQMKVAEEEDKELAKKKVRLDAMRESIEEAFLETRKYVRFGFGAKRNE